MVVVVVVVMVVVVVVVLVVVEEGYGEHSYVPYLFMYNFVVPLHLCVICSYRFFVSTLIGLCVKLNYYYYYYHHHHHHLCLAVGMLSKRVKRMELDRMGLNCSLLIFLFRRP